MFENFRQNVKELLKSQQLTYAQLGKRAGIAESTIKCFMCGANSSRRVAEKIADSLNCALQYENGKYILANKAGK